MTAAVRLESVTKQFGEVTAVDGIDLDIPDGEFFSMLGPSGSGKTTVLRMIAGFETPTAGRVDLGGEDVTTLPPFARDVNTVFQDYALFPHMTCSTTSSTACGSRRCPGASAGNRAQEALEPCSSAGTAPQARPALGRPAAAGRAGPGAGQPAAVLLLDEPLGALDLKLRREMQVELKELQRDVGITFVFVTHDQEEALTMSDRIAVFNEGRIEQVATPARALRAAGDAVRGRLRRHLQRARRARPPAIVLGATGTFSVRPEKIHLARRRGSRPAWSRPPASCEAVVYLGSVPTTSSTSTTAAP